MLPEVKENPETCSIPFIMLTAKVEDDDIIHGLQLGADDYVLKPFTPGILKAKVSSLINGRQTLKQMYTKLFKLPGTDTIVVSEPEQAGEEVKTEIRLSQLLSKLWKKIFARRTSV